MSVVKNKFSTKYYNEKGEYHREDGPAIDYFNGDKEWYQNGLLHRIDGPAREYSSVGRHWFRNGLLHRIDGPAVEYSDGDKYWYYQGEYIKCQSQEEYERIIKLIFIL